VTVTIYQGEKVGIIGQNGSGKTTLVKHFNGLLKPTEGTVLVMGQDTRRSHVSQLARRVGYVFQNPDHQLFSNSVREELAFGPKNVGMSKKEIEERVRYAAEFMKLEHLMDVHPYRLSRGERQRLAIASVLAMNPEVMILDEPTGGANREQLQRLERLVDELHSAGKTVILITHDMNVLAETCERTIAMWDGQIILDGATRDVLREEEKLAQTFLTPPPVVRLSLRAGWPQLTLTVDEAERYLLERGRKG
jgi:energy-coupling factor transport system ATP-binding protein